MRRSSLALRPKCARCLRAGSTALLGVLRSCSERNTKIVCILQCFRRSSSGISPINSSSRLRKFAGCASFARHSARRSTHPCAHRCVEMLKVMTSDDALGKPLLIVLNKTYVVSLRFLSPERSKTSAASSPSKLSFSPKLKYLIF